MPFSLEAKKKMKESSIKGDISSLEAKMNGVFTQIGREAYENLPDALAGNEKTKELSDSVGEIRDQISVKEKELEEEMERFDKEIAAVKEPQGDGEQAAPPAAAAPEEPPKAEPEPPEQPKKFCTQCGAQNNADAAFCGNCGAKM